MARWASVIGSTPSSPAQETSHKRIGLLRLHWQIIINSPLVSQTQAIIDKADLKTSKDTLPCSYDELTSEKHPNWTLFQMLIRFSGKESEQTTKRHLVLQSI